jgi:Undecaprenyl-phosphate glucose phosphotransferase
MISFLRSLRSRKHNIKHILLVTDSQEMADAYMEEILNNPHFGYNVIGYVGNLNVIGLAHLGTTGDLDRVLKEYRPDEVVMAFDTVRKKLITKYISICNNNCIKILVVPAICGYFRSPKQVTELGNLPLIDIRSTPLDKVSNQWIKRLMDIVGSLVLIVLTSPLMLVTAIGVRLSSPGPILFRQIRVGKNNKEFTMYKFRSMRVNNEEKTGWSTENDPRKTRFGAFIRKFALDELPQFFNVLKGDMSLVGPRPEVPFYVEKFRKQVPLYMLKHTLRPGITGLAQVKGLRGDTSIQARIDEDISYIENWTFWGDIRILLITPFCAVNRHEKYAAKDEEEKRKQERRGVRPESKEDDDDGEAEI